METTTTSKKAEVALIESLRICMMVLLYLNKRLAQGTCTCISNSSKQFIRIYVDTFGGRICSDLCCGNCTICNCCLYNVLMLMSFCTKYKKLVYMFRNVYLIMDANIKASINNAPPARILYPSSQRHTI